MTVNLESLACCFEGLVPSAIATCSREGEPNASYLSHVYRVDDRHVATSYQFFNKTRANLLENPYATIRIAHPENLKHFYLKVKYLRSEEDGPIFSHMSVRLDVIAAHEGMGSIFKLKAADIYEVLAIEEDSTVQSPNPSDSQCPAVSLEDLRLMRVISNRMNQALNMEELFDQSLQFLHNYLGWTHMILLLTDETGKNLLTHASFGYPSGGVGSEVHFGEGLIGLCAKHRRLYQVSALEEGLRYAKAAIEGSTNTDVKLKIPLPGLLNPASQIAVPLEAQGEFLGVLAIESTTQTHWGEREQLLLSTFGNLLAMGIRAFEGQDKGMKAEALPAILEASAETTPVLRLRFVHGDDLLFVNDQYLIKNIPGRILWYLLQTYQKTGRVEFSNMELRSEKTLLLPEIKDNLEARLILLRKRLEEQCPSLRLVSIGRGKFKIEIKAQLELL